MHNSHPLEDFVRRLRDLIQRGFPADDAAFNRLALALFALQLDGNGPFHKFCQRRGRKTANVAHWNEIPAMPTRAFKELELTSLAPHERATVFHSSGTTAHKPSRHFHSASSLGLYEASLLAWFAIHVLREQFLTRHEGTLSSIGGNPPNEYSPRDPLNRSIALGEAEARQRPEVRQSSGAFDHPGLPKRQRTGALQDLSVAATIHGERLGQGEPAGHFTGGLPILSLTPPPTAAPHSSLAHMMATVIQAFGGADSVFVGGTEATGAWNLDAVRAIELLRNWTATGSPVVVLGTAFSFVHLLDFMAAEKLTLALPAGSRVMETGGYKGRSRELPKAELHQLITRFLGVPDSHIICEYGMSELSSQAYDAEVRSAECGVRSEGRRGREEVAFHHASPITRHFHFPPWARVQIVSPENGAEVGEGETGLIRVFDLANVASVMAIQTEDLGIRCGDGFELLGRVEAAEPRGCSLVAV